MKRGFRQEVLDAWLFKAISGIPAANDEWVVDGTNPGHTSFWAARHRAGWDPLVINRPPVVASQRTRLTAVTTGGLVGRLTSPAPLLTTGTALSAARVASLLTSAVVMTVPNTA